MLLVACDQVGCVRLDGAGEDRLVFRGENHSGGQGERAQGRDHLNPLDKLGKPQALSRGSKVDPRYFKSIGRGQQLDVRKIPEAQQPALFTPGSREEDVCIEEEPVHGLWASPAGLVVRDQAGVESHGLDVAQDGPVVVRVHGVGKQ
jgi:hypothetical protein